MVFNAILNALKSDPQRVEGGIPFLFLPLLMRRNYSGLACEGYLRGVTSLGKLGTAGPMRSGPSKPLGSPYSDVLTSGGDT